MGIDFDLQQLSDMIGAATKVAEINRESGIPQENFVMEEASEFTKAYMKFQRDKAIQDEIQSEAIDIATACLVYFIYSGMNLHHVMLHMEDKLNRAITRYMESGET